MHARHRNPGNGYRSSSMGMGGGVSAASRISPESSIRGHGMYNSEYRNYNRGFGRGQPKPYQARQPPPPRRADIFTEAGRLATEYLVSKGLLPPNVLSGKWQNGSLKNQIGDFQGFRQQEAEDGLQLPLEGRTSALARLGNVSDAVPSRRRFNDECNPTGSRSFTRGRRSMGSFKNYGSDWGRETGKSGSWSDKARAYPNMEGEDDSLSGSQDEQQVGNGGQKSHMSELAPKSDGAGDLDYAVEKFELQDDMRTKASSFIGKDLSPETDVELTKRSDDMKLLNEENVEMKDATRNDQVVKQSAMEDVPIQHCVAEGDSMSRNVGDLLSFSRFVKVPTKTRSSLTMRGSKIDPVPVTDEENNCNMGQEGNNYDMGPSMGSEVPVEDVSVDDRSVDAPSNSIQPSKCLDSDVVNEPPPMGSEVPIEEDVSVDDSSVNVPSNPIQISKCLDSDIVNEPPFISAENDGELGPMYVDQGKCTRSQSFPDRSFMNEQDSSEVLPGIGRCSSMIMERGEKRAIQHIDIRDREGIKKPREWVPVLVTQTDENLHLSKLNGKQLTLQEGRSSTGKEVILSTEQERSVDISLYQRGGVGQCVEYAEEKQLFPGSFKICDLNLMEASEVNENIDRVRDPILFFPSIPESKKEATPVDVDLSISNNGNISGKYGNRCADGKEVEVIDLESDSLQEDMAFNNSDRKAEAVFTGLESFPNHAQNTNVMSDVQDGYGLMISELIGTEISNCSSVPADISSLHNEMTLNNGEGILGDDESIYMSLGEIPISFVHVWDQTTQEYEKPF